VTDEKVDVASLEEKGPEGIGGWLILVAIGVVLRPPILIYNTVTLCNLVGSRNWEMLTAPDSPAYLPLWGPVVRGEIIANILLLIGWSITAVLFFYKKKSFPWWFIGMMTFGLAFVIADMVAFKAIFPDKSTTETGAAADFLRAFIVTMIWIPYMLVSKRVKATFVR